ncbi:hypothetical protein K439DRAFT_1396440 [Ramaria rubella]|nr:hypothetical protein K439DRAFT_1396440 [Ramaria rubella]
MLDLLYHLWSSTFYRVLVTAFVLYKSIAYFLYRNFRAKLTALDDIPLCGIPRKGGKINGTAVVCGGSLAGLFTARACSDHFENVLIIEPEEWLLTNEGVVDRHREKATTDASIPKRSRVPHYIALHAYQPPTTWALRRWFANLDLEVYRTGGRIFTGEYGFHMSGIPAVTPVHKYHPGGLPPMLIQSRPLFETMVRRLLRNTCDNVKQVAGTVIGLVRDSHNSNEVSVRMRSPTGEESTFPATLVIDCTGPALGGYRWLQALPGPSNSQPGEPSFEDIKTSYTTKMAYTVCEFDVPPQLFDQLHALGFPGDFASAGMVYINFPDAALDKRGLVMKRNEDNYLAIACGGWDWREEMKSVEDMKNFISDMISTRPVPPWVMKMLDLFEAEQVPRTFFHSRCPPHMYIEYHRMKGLPSNFIAIGDSVMQMNPMRGQGATKACIEAITLNALLSRCKTIPGKVRDSLPATFGPKFFSAQASRTGFTWDIYKTEDYAWKTTIPVKGDNLETWGAGGRAFGSLLNRLVRGDREVAAMWWLVISWCAPSTDFFSPIILLKMAWMRVTGVPPP